MLRLLPRAAVQLPRDVLLAATHLPLLPGAPPPTPLGLGYDLTDQIAVGHF